MVAGVTAIIVCVAAVIACVGGFARECYRPKAAVCSLALCPIVDVDAIGART